MLTPTALITAMLPSMDIERVKAAAHGCYSQNDEKTEFDHTTYDIHFVLLRGAIATPCTTA